MSDELSDDLDTWPSDPFKLLGVTPGAHQQELKRAYIQLIKRFKPEQYPDHFRRIRAAYESARYRLDLFSRLQSDSNSAPSDDAPDPVATEPQTSNIAEQAWQLACDGKPQDAYFELRGEYAANRATSDVFVRLYWLLRLYPEIDPERKPVDWLGESLRRGSDEIAADLFRREPSLNPRAAESESIDRLLESNMPVERISELLRWRWQAAAVTQNRRLINDDIGRMRDRIRSAPEQWLQLLFGAADVLAWGRAYGDDSYIQCRQEIRSLDHLANDYAVAFDRLDHQELLVGQWWSVYWKASDNLSGLHLRPTSRTEKVLDLIPRIWMLPSHLLVADLIGFAADVAESPEQWLDHLDRINGEAPVVIECLAGAIRELPDRDSAEDETALRGLISDDLKSRKFWSRYRANRGEFLSFCLWRFADPIWTAGISTEDGVIAEHGYTPSALVNGDYPLQAVYYAVDRLEG